MMRSSQIDHYEARSVFHGLLEGEDFRSRVAGRLHLLLPTLQPSDTLSLAQLLSGE